MSWSSQKKKEGIFLYRLFCAKEIFLTFVFFNICVLTWVLQCTAFKCQKTLLHTLFCLFLKSSKALSVSLRGHFGSTLILFKSLNSGKQKQLFRCPLRKRCSGNNAANLQENTLCNFIEIALRHGCSSVNWLHIFETNFCKNMY